MLWRAEGLYDSTVEAHEPGRAKKNTARTWQHLGATIRRVMSPVASHLVEQRAIHLTVLVMTRHRPGVQLQIKLRSSRFDLEVFLPSKSEFSPAFGVEVKGATAIRRLLSTDLTQLRDRLTTSLKGEFREVRFPVAIAAVDVISESVYFGWVVRPVFQQNQSRLRLAGATLKVEPLTEQSLKQTVEKLSQWHNRRP